MEQLEEKVNFLTKLRDADKSLRRERGELPIKVNITPIRSTERGLTLHQLAKQLNLNYRTLGRRRSRSSEDEFLDYLEAESGSRWTFDSTLGRHGKYYPRQE